jgi:hypothetical protein
MIAALFVETGGCYFGLPGVDPWDEARDARLYDGPYPVVAHPPCARWGRFATWHGGRACDDGGCFETALNAVRRHGGIIEHPAGSLAWQYFGLPVPPPRGWRRDLFGASVCAVEQGHYGHPARKATWLYYIGKSEPPDLIWGPSPQRLPARRLSERGYESARRCGACSNLQQPAAAADATTIPRCAAFDCGSLPTTGERRP